MISRLLRYFYRPHVLHVLGRHPAMMYTVASRPRYSIVTSFIKQWRISFSTSFRRFSYADTIPNLQIGEHTRVIIQGFTGKQATVNAEQSIRWGTNIVGGVTPGRNGEHLGLPLLSTVEEAVKELKPDATGIFVAAQHAAKAIEEAIEAEVPLIVAVAEGLPIHDVLRIHSILKTQSKSRFVGGNSPGIISPIGKCRIGFQPLPYYAPGVVGIVAKSGTLSYEAVASTTDVGLGQSLCIGMGGDVLAGTNFVDALKIFEHDEATKGIIIVGEIGGSAEENAAEWIKEYRSRNSSSKPIVALIGGLTAKPGRVMGHAGAFTAAGELDAAGKISALENAGCSIVKHPEYFGPTMKSLLNEIGHSSSAATIPKVQTRSMHTAAERPQNAMRSTQSPAGGQRRSLHIHRSDALKLLKEREISVTENAEGERFGSINIVIDRNSLSPCIVASLPTEAASNENIAARFQFDYIRGLDPTTIILIMKYLNLDSSPKPVRRSFEKLIDELVVIFMKYEAFSLGVEFQTSSENIEVTSANFNFDDAAFVTSRRHEELHKLRDFNGEDPDELQAERDGCGVYIKLPGNGNIGTIVNGAGLAMNTNDALAAAGAQSANFLDTGGKASAETVKRCFQTLLRDERLKVIFVNIFGGLTLCDMVAQAIIDAFAEMQMTLPVVVRLRGTNEEIGQKMIAESGLKLHAFDTFEAATTKVIELANS